MSLATQLAADLAALQASDFGGMVSIQITDGTTTTTVTGWWREADPDEEQQEKGLVQVRRATAWVRVADLPTAPARTASWALGSEPTVLYNHNEPLRNDGHGLWQAILAHKTVIEHTPLRRRRGLEA